MAERPLNDRRSIVGRLYDQHGASLYRYALMLLADPAAAADAVQQVFTALLRPAATIAFDNEAHYLRRAIRNECFSALRRRRVRDEDAAGSLLEPASSDPVAPEERIALER
ncbi:MAG: sigma factor, partial [Acidobacteriota bacterium]|nr:sigma factor [Acidobacteriota bacterium]